MCKFLGISRQAYYYESKQPTTDAELAKEIEKIFVQSRKNYGTRKIKKVLEKAEYPS